MTDDRKAQMQHIAALLDERRKIETWIAALDARRSGTPTHVMLRVEQDYRAKLADAHARLSQEMGAVRTIAAQLEQDLVEHDAGQVALVVETHSARLEEVDERRHGFTAVVGRGSEGGYEFAQGMTRAVEFAVGVEGLRFQTSFDP